MTEKQKAAAGFLYNANFDPEIAADIARCKDMCYEYNMLRYGETEKQQAILRRMLSHIGKESTIVAPFWCDYGYNTSIGSHSFINHGLMLTDGAQIIIGDHVFIAPNVVITTANHAIDPDQRREGLEVARPVSIGSDVWIGSGAIILPGVTIGEGSVIGAGSVVTKDIPPCVVAVGNPCRVLRPITEADKARWPSCPESQT